MGYRAILDNKLKRGITYLNKIPISYIARLDNKLKCDIACQDNNLKCMVFCWLEDYVGHLCLAIMIFYLKCIKKISDLVLHVSKCSTYVYNY